MTQGFGTLAAALYLATASPVFAHHSHPLHYDWCKSITVEGRVESVEYKNPHSIIVVRQDDDTAYTVDWLALDGLTRNRILESAKGALAFGARVSVTGSAVWTTSACWRANKKRPCGANPARPTSVSPGISESKTATLILRRHENSVYFFTLKKAVMVEPSLAVTTAR